MQDTGNANKKPRKKIYLFYSIRRLHGRIHTATTNTFNHRKQALKKLQTITRIRFSKIHVMSIDETFDAIENGSSIARFGDGEMDIIKGGQVGFQQNNRVLRSALHEVLTSESDSCLIAVPDALSTLRGLTDASKHFWVDYLTVNWSDWTTRLSPSYTYGNANVSRLWLRYQNPEVCSRWFNRLKTLWKDKDIVTIEGTQTRLGCGNDLFDSAQSVQRILAPAENAFDLIDEIDAYVQNNIDKNVMIVMALGPTATVLAYRLSQHGYQALDFGHFDIEYEWFLKRATKRELIETKYTNEVSGGNVTTDYVDEQYQSQILTNIE